MGTTAARATTVFLDELGRARQTTAGLGADYSNDALVATQTYDSLGRVLFVSDQRPASVATALPYGTTYHYAADGFIKCAIRGFGEQGLTSVTNAANEVFPTCAARSYVNNRIRVAVSAPDSLQSGTAQAGVTTVTTLSATGRELSTETLKAGARLDLVQNTHDSLGQVVKMTRYNDPAGALQPVDWKWSMDSRGRVLTASEPDVAVRTFSYSNWGELLSTSWADTTFTPPRAMQVQHTYDSLGRMKLSIERENGTALANATYQWFYDTDGASPGLPPTFAAGRLTRTSSPIGDMHVSYDAYGHVDRRSFVSPEGVSYTERAEYRFDGALEALEFHLPDNDYAAERYDYTYDTASRLRAVMFGSHPVYQANTIDALGRLRAADFGETIRFSATHAETGRRLPIRQTITLDSGLSRTINYLSFDGAAREVARREDKNGVFGPSTTSSYDALGRLASSISTQGATTLHNTAFGYDAVGNLLGQLNATTGGVVRVRPSTTDRDRMCRVDYSPTQNLPCNVRHDGSGNVTGYPAAGGTMRALDYYPSGPVRSVQQGTATATFRYDGSGQISELDVTGAFTTDGRKDRRYGLVKLQDVSAGGVKQSVVVRQIPADGGIIATKRGPAGPWVYPFSEERGTRFTSDDGGTFTQELKYSPYGVATSSGAQPGYLTYTQNQWNGGDSLADLGLVQVGARMYDPVIGRFLSRDPLIVPRSAAAMNPYAFAGNDPVNASDPTGLDPAITMPDLRIYGYYNSSDGSSEIWIGTGLYAADVMLDMLRNMGGGKENNGPSLITEVNGVMTIGSGDSGGGGWLSSVGSYAGDVATGFGEGLWDTAAGLVNTFRHPIQTIEGIAHAAAHPIETGKAIYQGAKATVKAIASGDPKAIGKGLATIATSVVGGAAAKVVGKLGKGTQVARAGRGKNHLSPYSGPEGQQALGAHSTFAVGPANGKVTRYAEWSPNARNPAGFDMVKRVDTQYANPHSDFNSVTKESIPTPHVHSRSIPGGVRRARPDELPE